MSPSLSPSDLQVLQREADVAARRLRRQLRLPHDDLDDLRQDLLLDVIARLGSFDPTRGSLGAFVGTVMAHRATRIAAKAKRERLLYGISLDEPMAGMDGASRGDLIAEDEGLAAVLGQPTDAFTAVERRLDIERGLGCLAPGDDALCVALSHTTVDQLAAAGQGARSSLYRRVKEIRFCLMATGLQAA